MDYHRQNSVGCMLNEPTNAHDHSKLVVASNFHPLILPSFHIPDVLSALVQFLPPTSCHVVSRMNCTTFGRCGKNNLDQVQYKFWRQNNVLVFVQFAHIFRNDGVLRIVFSYKCGGPSNQVTAMHDDAVTVIISIIIPHFLELIPV